MADPTPASGGTMMRPMPSFSASRLACNGAAPPKATIVRSRIATPRSTACTRDALAMFSSTISATATAACSAAMARGAPMPASSARSAAAVAGRPRLGAGTIGPNQDALQAVHARDRAATGADLHHLDDGNAHRRAAALLKARLTIHFEEAGFQGLA